MCHIVCTWRRAVLAKGGTPGETRGRIARTGGVTQIPQNKTCCVRRIAATQVTDPATFSALLIAMPVDERVQVAAHAPRECA